MRSAVTAVVAAAAVVCFSVVVRELDWRRAHPYQLGPSGYIVALGVAGIGLAVGVGYVLHKVHEVERRESERREAEAREIYARLYGDQ